MNDSNEVNAAHRAAKRDELMTWGQNIVPCTCDKAYTLRGLEAPDCLWHNGAYAVLDELPESELFARTVRIIETACIGKYLTEIERLRSIIVEAGILTDNINDYTIPTTGPKGGIAQLRTLLGGLQRNV